METRSSEVLDPIIQSVTFVLEWQIHESKNQRSLVDSIHRVWYKGRSQKNFVEKIKASFIASNMGYSCILNTSVCFGKSSGSLAAQQKGIRMFTLREAYLRRKTKKELIQACHFAL